MRSIKEKSFELFPEMQTDSDDWDVIEAQCDRDEQRRVFVKGASYVLEQITEAIRLCDNDRNTDLYKSLWNCIDELRK
jgi:hypothetical protein